MSEAQATISFDARWLGDHGIGRFAGEVLSRLPGARCFRGRLKPTHPLDVFYLTARMVCGGGAVWYSPGYNAPLLGLGRYVFTIHDLNHIDHPANSSTLKRLYYRLVIRVACHRAARVLTVSEYSRRRIVQWAGIDPARVVNVGNGVSPQFSPSVTPYRPGYTYLLCVGNRKGHKNEGRLVEAFAASGIDSCIRLAFTGAPCEELLSLAARLGVGDRVVFLGRIEEQDLPHLYRGALALIFPSLYEGFGLPVLEAMACGTPVVTSNVTSLPEVAGDAALLVDPTQVAAIREGIERVVSDRSLREKLSALGLARVRSYSWDRVGEKVRAVLAEVELGNTRVGRETGDQS